MESLREARATDCSQSLVPGQRSGNINDAILYVQHADRSHVFDVGIKRIPVTLGNYDKLKTEYYAQFLEKIELQEIKTYVIEQTAKEQLTAQDLKELTNLKKILELPSHAQSLEKIALQEIKTYIEQTAKKQLTAQYLEDLTNFIKLLELQPPELQLPKSVHGFLDSKLRLPFVLARLKEYIGRKKEEFEQFILGCDTQIDESAIFFIEKFLSSEMNFKVGVNLDNILTKVNKYELSSDYTFEDQQMARIKYELLDKKHNENQTEQPKTETLLALNRAKFIAGKRQKKFVTKLGILFHYDKFKDCNTSTDFHNKLDSEDDLVSYRDLFNECEHWASHHLKCSDDLKTFLEAVAKNKKQTTNYLLTKDRTCQEKFWEIANVVMTIATPANVVMTLATPGVVATGANAVVNSPPVIGAIKAVVGLAGCIKFLPACCVAAVVGAVTVAYWRGVDYPEPENIQDIINKQETKNDITVSRKQGQTASQQGQTASVDDDEPSSITSTSSISSVASKSSLSNHNT